MARYALVAPDNSIYTERSETQIDLGAGVRDGYRWLVIENVTDDRSTTSETVTEPMVQTIEADRVLRTRIIRDKTAQELDDEANALILSQADQVLGKAIFKLLNDFRASQGQQPVTRTQFLAWMKAQL